MNCPVQSRPLTSSVVGPELPFYSKCVGALRSLSSVQLLKVLESQVLEV